MPDKMIFGETFIVICLASIVGGLAIVVGRIETFIPYLAVALVFTMPVFTFIKNKLMKENGYNENVKEGLTFGKLIKNPIFVAVLVITALTGIVDAMIIIKTFVFVLSSKLLLKGLSVFFTKIKNVEVPEFSMSKSKIKMPALNNTSDLAFGAKKKQEKDK